MTEIVGTQRRSKVCCLTELGNDLPDASFSQRSALTEKEMPIGPPAPGSNHLSLDCRPLAPVFCQMLAMGEISIERFACFLDQRVLTMSESLPMTNDEQPTRAETCTSGIWRAAT